jgi:ABC-2 type transport system permease protein
MFYFLARLVDPGASSPLARYGGDFFSFVIIGIAFRSYLGLSMDTMASSLRREQLLGTLESVAATGTPLPVFAAGGAVWQFIFASYRVLVYLLFGWLFFGLDLSAANLPAAALTLALSVLAFAGVGVVSGSFILVFKQGDPVRWLYGGAATLLGGVYFPVQMLPDWLRPFSVVFPITHALEAMRRAVLLGTGVGGISVQLLVLAGFAAVSVPAGALAFRWALRRIRLDGTLGSH